MSFPDAVEQNFDLARLTTVRTGGAADYYARPESNEAVVELLAWASSNQLPVGVIGSGSNLLIADKGFRGLVIKLDGHLTEVHIEGDGVLSGGGARLPSLAAKTAEQGLAGLEFGVNIPGTVGGAIRMNANAYGGELASVLEWAEVASPDGIERRAPEDFEFTYRHSNIAGYQVVTRAQFRLTKSTPDAVKHTLSALRGRRKAAQPSGIKTFGSTFKNPDDPRAEGRTAGQLLEAAGCKGLEQGGARFSPKHANFVENFQAATTADVVALIAAGRARVQEQFGVRLETEVQVLGDVDRELWESE
ncbi:MAG: UDP-N-acetylmuramate dehydrogenase [Solirubrobacterales bacterium]|nr:UDP-N-acetylmuramate dehydrogenase [Solirubrobacterales bacterium]